MANYQASKALMGKEKGRAKKGARKSAVKKGETNEMTPATAGFVRQDMLTDPFFFPRSFRADWQGVNLLDVRIVFRRYSQ